MSFFSFRRLALFALGALVVVGVAACGEATVKQDDVQNEVKKFVEASGTAVKKVECPDDIKAKKGSKDKCKVTPAEGDPYDVTVVQADDNGNFTIEDPTGGADAGAAGDEAATDAAAPAEGG